MRATWNIWLALLSLFVFFFVVINRLPPLTRRNIFREHRRRGTKRASNGKTRKRHAHCALLFNRFWVFGKFPSAHPFRLISFVCLKLWAFMARTGFFNWIRVNFQLEFQIADNAKNANALNDNEISRRLITIKFRQDPIKRKRPQKEISSIFTWSHAWLIAHGKKDDEWPRRESLIRVRWWCRKKTEFETEKSPLKHPF